jgi:hypothetical protein
MKKPIVVFILTILSSCSCSSEYKQKIIGTWEDIENHKWVFTVDGKIIYENNNTDHREYDYKIKKNKLSFTIPRENSTPEILQLYNISLSNEGEKLDLTDGTTVPGWVISGPGWPWNRLTRISGENILEPGGSLNTENDDISYKDKYGNLVYQYERGWKVSYTLSYTPDFELMSQLESKLYSLTIDNKSITDISFLKNFPHIKELNIYESNISSLEPLKYLEDLETLYIAKNFPKTIDVSIFMDFENLKKLDLGNNEIENIGVIYKLYDKLEYQTHIHLEGIKGKQEYREKYNSLWDSESYVFHYDKYHVMQNGVKIRAKPSENSGIIAELNLHDEIQIIEFTDKEEKINDIWSYWYKIKHKNVTGYIFGGYIAAETFITDIDKNGIKDYIYLRYHASDLTIDPDKDILVYINNKKIDTSVLSKSERYYNRPFEGCEFEERDGYVLVTLIQLGRETSNIRHNFKVLPNGKIEEVDY